MLPDELKKALRRRLLIGALVGALAGLLVGFAGGFAALAWLANRVMTMPIRDGAAGVAAAVPLPVPKLERVDAPDLNFGLRIENEAGRPLSLATFRGKVIFLNLWATWCGPCIAEMPTLATLYKEIGSDSRFAFVSVAKDDRPTLQRFLAKEKLPFPVYRLPGGSEIEGSGTAVPVTLIADRNGKILARVVDAAQWSDPRFLAELRALANGGQS